MPAPFGHVDVSTLMGSWPVLPDIGTSGAVLQPRTLNERATVLGVARETPSGFAVVGFSFYLWSDNPAGIPTQHNILFSGTGNLTLAQVVSQINVAVTETVAFQDNGFLRLNSPRTGQTSYLRVQTDPSSGPTALVALGLFAETVSKGGSIRQAQHIDPDRQVSLPGQLAWSEGEPFEARVFNRMALQLGINSDRACNMLEQKRVAIKKELETVYSAVRSAGGYGEGIQLTGDVYVGDGGTTNPSETRLEKLFAVLDNDGNDIVKENQTVVATSTATGTTYTWDTDLVKQKVAWTAGPPFTIAHVNGDFYIKPAGLTGGPAVLNGKLLKITELVDANTVVVLPVDPGTGIRYQITQGSLQSDLVRVDAVRALVTGVYDVPGGSRVENVPRTRQSSTAITRVDKNNRIHCAAANFQTGGNLVAVGDVVTWSGGLVTQPYSNNGTYRVSAIIDRWTLELVGSDWSPVYLNPDDAATIGNVVVQTDGRFWTNPFLLLKPPYAGAYPATTDNIRVVYLGMNNLKAATDDPAVFVGPGVRYVQEVDANITAAILAIIGPSATTINDYLYGDRTRNLEEVFNEFRLEHWASGRHSTIRPDYINMEPNNTGPTVIVRNTAADESAHNLKFQLRNSADTLTLADINANGFFGSVHMNPYPRSSVWAGCNQSFSLEMRPPDSVGFSTSVNVGVSVLAADTYYYLVAGVGPDGISVYGPTTSSEVQALVTTSNNKYVRVWWNPVPGAARYLLFRRAASNPTVWLGHYTDTSSGTPGNPFFEDFGSGWGSVVIDPIAIRSLFPATSTRLQAQTGSWIGTPLAVNGGTVDNATFSVCGPNAGAGKVAAFYRPTGKVFQGTGIQGVGAPLMVLDMEDGISPAIQHIAKFEFKRWGGSWWNLISDLRVMGDANYSTFNFRDNAGYDDVSIGVDAANGGQLTIQRTAAGNPSITVSKTYGDFLSMSSLSRTVKLGIRSAGNFYLDTGAPLYPFVIDTSNGRVGVGFPSLDTAPGVTLDVRGNGAFDYNGATSSVTIGNATSWGHRLQIRGTSVGASGVAEVIFGEEVDTGRYVMSLRGDSEDGGVNSFRFLYHSATAFYDVLKSVPTSSGAETYTLYLHDGVFRIDSGGASGRIGNHNFAADSLELQANGSGNRQCYIDFWAAAGGTDYEARIFRNAGADGNFLLRNNGTGGITLQSLSGTAGFVALQVDSIFFRGAKAYWGANSNGCFAPLQPGYCDLGEQVDKWSQAWISAVYCGWVSGCDPSTSPSDSYQAVAHGAQNAILANCRIAATGTALPADHWGVSSVVHTNGTAMYDINLDWPIQVNSVVVVATPQTARIAGRLYHCHTEILSTTQIRVWCQIQIGPAFFENTDFAFNLLVIGRPNVLPTWP